MNTEEGFKYVDTFCDANELKEPVLDQPAARAADSYRGRTVPRVSRHQQGWSPVGRIAEDGAARITKRIDLACIAGAVLVIAVMVYKFTGPI